MDIVSFWRRCCLIVKQTRAPALISSFLWLLLICGLWSMMN
uniref:Uncharacterized protein n=1 Tax=Rhizophora mucronata TaxID=61149 RepID=A0A2P2Q224_RHIMU